jgi:hypothetical protein
MGKEETFVVLDPESRKSFLAITIREGVVLVFRWMDVLFALEADGSR